MKLATNGSELLNRQLAIYTTPNLKLVNALSKAVEDIGNERAYPEKARSGARSQMIEFSVSPATCCMDVEKLDINITTEAI